MKKKYKAADDRREVSRKEPDYPDGRPEGQGWNGKNTGYGDRFANLCALNEMIIGGSIFQHKRIQKTTLVSPDHITENLIDYVLFNEKF